MADPRSLVHRSEHVCECGCHRPLSGVVPSDHYREKARQMVETNVRLGYTDLLVEQLASAMNNETYAIGAAYRMRSLVGVCLRLLDRAGVKPKGDETIAMRLADELTHAHPRRMGGNSWLEEDQLRIDLETFREAA